MPCNYTKIDQEYLPACKYYWLRFASASFGSATAPLIYGITRGFGGGAPAGVLASALFIFDGLNLGESRLVLVDSQLIFWLAACLFVGLRWFARYNAHVKAVEEYEARVAAETAAAKAEEEGKEGSHGGGAAAPAAASAASAALSALRSDARYMDGFTRVCWIVAVGVACGNAVSVKFTGLATPAFLGLESIFALLVLRRAYPFGDLLAIAAVAFLTFSGYWWVHFELVRRTGDGDTFMFAAFQRTLLGNPAYDPLAPRPGFWSTMLWLQRDMIVSNASILEPHNWDSVWWEWVLNLRGVLYYTVDQAHSYTRAVYLLGNPLVIWGLLAAVAAAAALLALWQRLRHDARNGLWRFAGFFRAVIYCLAVYTFNLLPYMAVKRSCFIYHYMPAMMYAEVLAGLLVEQLAGRRWAPAVVKALLVPVVAIYLFYAPWVYGFALSNDAHERRRWLPRWN